VKRVKLMLALAIAMSAVIVTPSAALASGAYTVQKTTGASITAAATDLNIYCDDCSKTVGTPFPLKFYGTGYSTIGVSSNGNIQFGAATPFDAYFNACLPSADFVEPVLMPYWDDLTTTPKTAGYGVFTKVTGTAPARQFIVEWKAAFVSGGAALDFEAIFSEASSTITFVYGAGTWGQASTVGVQESGTGAATQFVCNGPGVGVGVRLDHTYSIGGGGGTPPTVSNINNLLTAASSPTTLGVIPVQTTWVGTDPDDAIASYQVQMRANKGAWTDQSLTLPTATSLTVDLASGGLYNFRVRATDAGGHIGAWAAGVAFTLKGLQETGAAYTGSWTRPADADAWGGMVESSTTQGADATITFTGRNLALVATKGPMYGSIDVYVDGTLWKTLKCSAPVLARRQVIFRYSTLVLTNSTHTVRIVNDATAGHPKIDIDGFISFKS
jgi:hypothetical protein